MMLLWISLRGLNEAISVSPGETIKADAAACMKETAASMVMA